MTEKLGISGRLAAFFLDNQLTPLLGLSALLLGVFGSLGDNRREALKIAAGFRGEEAFDAGISEEQALETVLPHLSRETCSDLAQECLDLYLWDRLGSDN